MAKKKQAAKKKPVVKESGRGKRYTPKQKAGVLIFVDKHNAKHGRGGAAAASRKYGISQLTISKWMKESGAPSPSRKTSVVDFDKVLQRIGQVHREIAAKQSELDKLRKEYAELKAQL